jgi:hypothetical protein
MFCSFRSLAFGVGTLGFVLAASAADPQPAGTGSKDAAPPPADRPTVKRAPSARVATRSIGELSGIVASRKRPGVFWSHGDSGNEAKIVAFDASGKILAEVAINNAPNVDWEDICADEDGHLYIGDIGDGGGYPTRTVYEIAEPDPRQPPSAPVDPVAKYQFRYPHDRRFDAESLFYYDGALYLIAKSHWLGSRLYRIEPFAEGAARLVEVAVLPVTLATGADASGDGKRLLVASYPGLWVFPITGGAQFVDPAGARLVNYEVDSRIEGCCFAGDDIVLLGENGIMLRVTPDDLNRQIRVIIK